MSILLFTATGCARCAIAKKFIAEKGLACDEHDAIGAGKERFGQFYRAHRGAVFRGKEGIEFPVLAQGGEIRQGVAAVLAWLQCGSRLDGFIGRSEPSKGWVGGLHVSRGDPGEAERLAGVLGVLKRNGLKLQLDTDGRNPAVLERLLRQGIGDRVVMDLKGPQALYPALVGAPVDPQDVERSMVLAAGFPEFRYETTVAPVPAMEEGREGCRYLSPEEIAATARWLKEATGSYRQPYFLRIFDPRATADDRLGSVAALSPGELIRHRTAARNYQVLTEVQTIST